MCCGERRSLKCNETVRHRICDFSAFWFSWDQNQCIAPGRRGLVCRWGKNSPALSSRVRSTAHGRTPSAQGSPSTSVWTGLLNVSGCLTRGDKHMPSGRGSLTYGMAGNGVLGGEELSVAGGRGAQGNDWEAVRKSLRRSRLDSSFTYKQLEVMKCM